MKKLLLILLCLPMIFSSCSKEDDETIQPNNTSALSIDVNLVGYWLNTDTGEDSFIFGSNGEFYWDTGYNKWGSYWTESGYIVLEGLSTSWQSGFVNYSDVLGYNIEGDELTISSNIYLKQ
jgi:hypothetical protein